MIDGDAVAQLQSENDNLKFKLLEQVGQTKSIEEQLNQLVAENAEIKTKQRRTKQTILVLEQKNDQLKILQDTHCDQVSGSMSSSSIECTPNSYGIIFDWLFIDQIAKTSTDGN